MSKTEIQELLPKASLAKKSIPTGTHVQAIAKSKHSGQAGIVVADYGTMLLVKADDQSYSLASTNSIGDGKYFQLDSRLYKILKGTNES